MTKKELAKAFSNELQKEIGVDKLKIVNKLNFKETNKLICHSHDFCDANQMMLNVLGNPEDVERFWETASLAWTLAKQNNFYIGD